MDAREKPVIPSFAPGDRVRVRRAWPPGHTRAPYFRSRQPSGTGRFGRISLSGSFAILAILPQSPS